MFWKTVTDAVAKCRRCIVKPKFGFQACHIVSILFLIETDFINTNLKDSFDTSVNQ